MCLGEIDIPPYYYRTLPNIISFGDEVAFEVFDCDGKARHVIFTAYTPRGEEEGDDVASMCFNLDSPIARRWLHITGE